MDNITFINVGRLKRAGHVLRMDQQQPAKRILDAKLEGTRRREGLNSGGKTEWIRMLKLWEKEIGRT
jgi:hypothetical protein